MIEEYKKGRFNFNRFIVILLVVSLVWSIESVFFNTNNVKEELFVIEPGESVNVIATRLKSDDYIKSGLIFKAYLQITNKGSQIKAGEHYLSTSMSMAEIVNKLILPVAQKDEQITLVEGWRNLDIAEYLESSMGLSVNDFLSASNREYPTYDWLPNITMPNYLQGYLFPDTYRILPGAAPEDIIIKLLQNFEIKVYKPLQTSIVKNKLTLHEILTLASIVEMEVGADSDRRIVADIFLRRLADNYPLQSDATVNYVTQSSRTQSTIKDTKIDSPYNTYKYVGLPPGPIGNPGLSAIEAVLKPLPNTYYFFLTKKDGGQVIYSRTYDEHLQNKAKYLD